MYNSSSENKGQYSKFGFVKRGLELVSPFEFYRTAKLHTPNMNFIQKFIMMIDFYFCILKYGTIASDYFEYEFWKKKACVRKTYITMLKSIKMQKFFNQGSPELLVNKRKFNEHFKSVRNINNFYFDEDKSLEDFQDFVIESKHNIIAKTFWGASGVGIYKPDVSTTEKIAQVYNKLKSDSNYFCEECFVQTGTLHEVNPNCVNTIRVYTLFDGEEVHIMNTCVRFGGSTSCVDNIHSGGMTCEIEPELGIVVGPGYNLLNEKFITHKLTGCVIPGLKIPQWGKVIDYCKKAAKLMPNYGYIGWDVAVSDESICIIEGNEVANVDLSQVACQRGIKDAYWEVMNKAKKYRLRKS